MPPSTPALQRGYNLLAGAAFRENSARLLSEAVKIPSVSYDDMGSVETDPRWKVFGDLADRLAALFPEVHAQLRLTRVNTYGLLYTWQGSDATLKPVVLMAHQDVVPADSLDRWTYPPFSGHRDEDYVYGRGASDCKNVLVGILESVESLLAAQFVPKRTVSLAR